METKLNINRGGILESSRTYTDEQMSRLSLSEVIHEASVGIDNFEVFISESTGQTEIPLYQDSGDKTLYEVLREVTSGEEISSREYTINVSPRHTGA